MRKKIFYVDDDLMVRRSFTRMLQRMRPDDTIVEFDAPEELLKEVLTGPKPDMIFTDRDMPGMNGETLARYLKEADFRGPIVMVTGRTTIVTPPPHVDELAHKPVDMKDLGVMVARYLDAA